MTNKKIKPELTPKEVFISNLRYEVKKYGILHAKAIKENVSLLPIVKQHNVPKSEVLQIIDRVVNDYEFDLRCKR